MPDKPYEQQSDGPYVQELLSRISELEADLAKINEEQASQPETVFNANLDLVNVDKYKARFRVTGKTGINVLNFSHLEIDRKEFPSDDNFNMDFITSDLKKAELPSPTTAGKDKDQIKAEKKVIKNAHGKLVDRQAKYKEFTKYELIIRKVA